MALTLGPVAFTSDNPSRVAVVVTSLIGDVKGEYYSGSIEEMSEKVADLVSWPDTQVWFYETSADGERVGTPYAVATRDGYTPCESICPEVSARG